jgi:hypothetical protein
MIRHAAHNCGPGQVERGGGAYMVVGLPFDWPRQPDLPDWTYFPRKDAIINMCVCATNRGCLCVRATNRGCLCVRATNRGCLCVCATNP